MDQAERLRNVIKQKRKGMQQKVARVVTITSGKGGVGKSNLAVNMAIWLSKMGKKVVIIDADLGLANVEVMFGTVPKYNLSDLIYQGRNIQEIITKGPLEIGFVSGGLGIAGMNNLSKDQIVYLVHSLGELNKMADVIIIDTGAGISDSVLEFVKSSISQSHFFQKKDESQYCCKQGTQCGRGRGGIYKAEFRCFTVFKRRH